MNREPTFFVADFYCFLVGGVRVCGTGAGCGRPPYWDVVGWSVFLGTSGTYANVPVSIRLKDSRRAE
jgi:hypothetical protein